MNMNGIYAYEAQAKGTTLSVTTKEDADKFEVGQQLQGIISNVSDQISIDFSGREVKVSPSAITNAKEGETRTFQIMEISNQSIVLKEVGSAQEQKNAQNRKSLTFTQVDADPEQIMKEDASKEEKADWKEMDDRATAEDYIRLQQQGISLEAFNLKRLERVLERVKVNRDLRKDQLKNQIEQFKQEVEQTRKIVEGYLPNHPAVEQIAEQFIRMDQPPTQENINRIVNALGLSIAAQKISDGSISYLIQNELEPTVENVYKAVHSGNQAVIVDAPDDFDDVKEAVEDLLQQEGATDDVGESMETAKWLYVCNLPITIENMDYKSKLERLGNQSKAEITQCVFDHMTDATQPEKTKYFDSSKERYHQLMSQLNDLHADTLPAKRQLEEIRMKLTYEAVQKISAQGIQIDSTQIDSMYEVLKHLEQDYYQGLMQDLGSTDMKEISLLSETQKAVTEIGQADVTILAKTFESRYTITLQQMSETAADISVRGRQAEESYEALMTAPRSDLGDSIQKAFGNVDSQLQNLGLAITQSNQRAIRILGYNRMELSIENVQAMKAYDAKVTEVLENLTPEVTASMIKDKINPLNLPMDELNEIALEYRKQTGTTSEQKYSEYLVNLEAKKGISEEEKEAYIGIYRLLYQVEKSDGAAIGALAKSGKELTLSNLLTEVRSRKAKAIDVNFNDETYRTAGGYENSITEPINTYFSETTSYGETLVRNILKKIQPETLGQVMDTTSGSITDMTLEQLEEGLEKPVDSVPNTYAEEQLDRLKEAAQSGTEALQLIQDYGEHDSVNQVLALQNGIQNAATIYETLIRQLGNSGKERIKEYTKKFSEAIGSKEELQKQYDTYSDELMQELSQDAMEESSATKCKDLLQMCDVLGIQKSLARKENYSIPVANGEGTVQMNLTVIHNSKEKGQIRIALPVDESQQINVSICVTQKKIQALFTCNQPTMLSKMSNQDSELCKKLESMGYEITQMNYSKSEQKAESFIYASGNIYKEAQRTISESEGEAQTGDMYQIAKVVVTQLSSLT